MVDIQLSLLDEEGLPLYLVNPNVSKLVSQEERMIRMAYSSLIPHSYQEVLRKHHGRGKSFIDISTPGNDIELKNASVETQVFNLFGQGMKNLIREKEEAKLEGREPKTSVMLLFNYRGVNKKKKTAYPGVAASYIFDMTRLVKENGLEDKILLLVEDASNPLITRRKNIEILRENDRKVIRKFYPFNYLRSYNKECLEIDRRVWGNEIIDMIQ